MRRLAVALTIALGLAAPAVADVDRALDAHILPGFARFEDGARDLAAAAAEECRAAAIAPAYHAAFDAWLGVAGLRLGPSETAALSLAFWPDSRGATRRTLSRLIAEDDPVVRDPDGYADVSIAARGFFALDMLLFDPDFANGGAGAAPGSATCDLVATVAADIARQADALAAAWSRDAAPTLRAAGAEGNATYLTEEEAVRALYTQILTSLEFTADTRLGQPLGTFERPRPARAEAWRSGRPLRNVLLASAANHDLAAALADRDLPRSDAALEQLREVAQRISDPAFQDVIDPEARLRVEILQQAVRRLRAAIETEVGAPLGIAPGFNAQDGD